MSKGKRIHPVGQRRPPPSYKGPMGPNGFRYRGKHGVIVVCRDESHQAEVYEALRASGHKCRVVTV